MEVAHAFELRNAKLYATYVDIWFRQVQFQWHVLPIGTQLWPINIDCHTQQCPQHFLIVKTITYVLGPLWSCVIYFCSAVRLSKSILCNVTTLKSLRYPIFLSNWVGAWKTCTFQNKTWLEKVHCKTILWFSRRKCFGLCSNQIFWCSCYICITLHTCWSITLRWLIMCWHCCQSEQFVI